MQQKQNEYELRSTPGHIRSTTNVKSSRSAVWPFTSTSRCAEESLILPCLLQSTLIFTIQRDSVLSTGFSNIWLWFQITLKPTLHCQIPCLIRGCLLQNSSSGNLPQKQLYLDSSKYARYTSFPTFLYHKLLFWTCV